MDLIAVNKKLTDILKSLEEKLPELEKYQVEYDKKYCTFLLNSGMGNAEKREAEAKLMIQQEPIFEKFHSSKLDVRLLLNAKEVYIEVGRNLRNIQHER